MWCGSWWVSMLRPCPYSSSFGTLRNFVGDVLGPRIVGDERGVRLVIDVTQGLIAPGVGVGDVAEVDADGPFTQAGSDLCPSAAELVDPRADDAAFKLHRDGGFGFLNGDSQHCCFLFRNDIRQVMCQSAPDHEASGDAYEKAGDSVSWGR